MRLRSHGVGSNSRILQDTLAYLIVSDDAERAVRTAQERYRARRTATPWAHWWPGASMHAPARTVWWCG